MLPLHALLSDSEVMRYIEPPFSMEQTRRFLEAAGLSCPPLVYSVDDCDGNFVGYVIYHDYDDDSVEIGWVLRRSVWGKGYARALTCRLIDRAAAEQKNVVMECSSLQEATKRIARSFGFSYTGRSDGCDVFRLECR